MPIELCGVIWASKGKPPPARRTGTANRPQSLSHARARRIPCLLHLSKHARDPCARSRGSNAPHARPLATLSLSHTGRRAHAGAHLLAGRVAFVFLLRAYALDMQAHLEAELLGYLTVISGSEQYGGGGRRCTGIALHVPAHRYRTVAIAYACSCAPLPAASGLAASQCSRDSPLPFVPSACVHVVARSACTVSPLCAKHCSACM